MPSKLKKNKIRHVDSKTIAIIANSYHDGEKQILIDAEDWERVNGYYWVAIKFGKNFYARASSKTVPEIKTCNITIHRLIMCFPSCLIDHANCNGLDNRKSNLRLADRSENMINRDYSNKTTGLRGVTLNNSGKYQARITKNSKRIHLGVFETATEAAYAYDRAAMEMHGEFKRLNGV